MKRFVFIMSVFFLLNVSILNARSITLKPYFGYATVRMDDMNSDLKLRVNELAKLVQNNLPIPADFNGNYAWGAQIQYRLQDNNFIHLNTFYFKEKNSAEDLQRLGGGDYEYLFSRQIELFEIGFGLHYFFNYSSWKRVNTYLGAGAGLGFGWSESDVFYQDQQNNLVDNRGEFSSNALTAHIAAGANIRIFPAFFISGEVGYRFANLQNLTGTFKANQRLPNGTINNTDDDFSTTAAYDFSGFYITIGIGIKIPLL